MSSADTVDGKESCSDTFGYYARAVAELLAEDDDDDDKVDDSKKMNGSFMSISPVDKALGLGFSELKRERLTMLLTQSVTDLKPKVDEMLEPVTNMNNLRMQLRCNWEQQDLPLDINNSARPPKKRKFAYSTSTAYDSNKECPANDVANGEEDKDLQLLKDSANSACVEAILQKHSDCLAATLENMRLRLEEVLNNVMSKCRPMSPVEKGQLKRRIQDLPEDNLVRVAEMLKCNWEPEGKSCDQIFVHFNEADNVTLWRLYWYVESVKKEQTVTSADGAIS